MAPELVNLTDKGHKTCFHKCNAICIKSNLYDSRDFPENPLKTLKFL